MDDFTVVLFVEQQQYRILRFELVSPLSNNEVNIGDLVNARESKNSMPESAKLLYRGSMADCEGEYANLVRTQIKAIPNQQMSKKMIDKMSKAALAKEYFKLRQDNDALSEKFDQQFLKINEMKKEILEKDQQNAELLNKLEDLQENNEISESTHDSIIQCNSCDQIKFDIAEIKANLASLVEVQNQKTSDEYGLVKIAPNSKIFVKHARFTNARSAKSPTSFAQRLLTAIFPYNDIIGGSLSGRKKNMLCANKVADIIDSAIHHYPKHTSANLNVLRTSVGWKITKLNSGESCDCDLLGWEDFNEEHFQSLQKPSRSASSTSKSQARASKSPTSEDNSSPTSIFNSISG